MTWKHIGKTRAFDHVALDQPKAQALNISGFKARDSQIAINQQALDMLRTMPSYDQEQVLKEIQFINKHPNNASSIEHKRFFWWRLFRSRTPFRNYHYLIQYSTNQKYKGASEWKQKSGVVIEQIFFDYGVVGANPKKSLERTLMYHVTQVAEGIQYDGVKTKDEIDLFEEQWDMPRPVVAARTAHISVNGMNNDLKKASWLMGVHTQVAYQKDNVKEYTLFHNPTDGGALDLLECLYDKTTKSTHNSKQLASVIAQQAGKPTKWTVHSQGAIIFHSALSYYKQKFGQALNQHQLAIHGSGTNVKKLTQLVESLGAKVIAVRNNPFDLVPNIAGGNHLGAGSLARSFKFRKLVTSNSVSAGASPHTLPYLGIEIYHDQLQELGFYKEAKKVRKYIDKHCV